MTRKSLEQPIEPDPCPELVIERGPKEKGVGSWVPRDKHRLLCDYLYASRYAWKKWPQRVFIDPFCGPGRIQVEGESFTREGGSVMAWRALAGHAPFGQMLVGDLVAERARACELRLKARGAVVESFVGPAERTVHEMVSRVPRGALCMAYIDPYNLELLSFSILQALATLNVDLAINFSTMDLQRNAEFEFDPARARFDDAAPGWRQDAEVRGASKQNVKLAFFQYWCRLVQGLGFAFSREMPPVLNDRGQEIYRMVFFARHDLPNRIWADVARGDNLQLF
ncbi:three-Cys-motif partner protein TcmP [Ideonella sp. DXS29W]|uniref:Three-Cys-motif partner protein TcmP n=1 Tax=Ideonella lacteola TaxID=2984193 RepID=A0ABU9BWP0_9BURK